MYAYNFAYPEQLWRNFNILAPLHNLLKKLPKLLTLFDFYDLQSTKILLLPSKYQMIMVPSNHSFFQYCDSNIRLFSIAPCNVITLNPLCILFGRIFFMASFLKLLLFELLLLKAIAIRLPLLFAKAFKSVNERQLAITIWEAIQKRSHEPIYKTHTKF